MAIHLFAGLPLWIMNLAIGMLVYIRAPRKPANQAFFWFVMTLVAWSFGVKMTHIYAITPLGVFWGRFAFASASLAASGFIAFCQAFPNSLHLFSCRIGYVFLLLSIPFVIASFSPWILEATSLDEAGRLKTHYGPLYPLCALFLLTAFGYGLWTLIRKWRTARGRSRLQLQYLGLGLFLLIAGALTTNLLIPALLRTSAFSAYGPYFTLFFVGFTAHAIVRHRLMDVRLIVRRGVTYGLSLGSTAGLMWLMGALGRRLWSPEQVTAAGFPLLLGIGGVVVFHPLRLAVQRLLDKYCYREPYDYQQATRTISQALASQLHLAPLCQHLAAFLQATLKVEAVAVYLCQAPSRLERQAWQGDDTSAEVPAVLDMPQLLAFLSRTAMPVMREELERWHGVEDVPQLAKAFALLRSEVVVPLPVEQRLIGLVTLGAKLSGDPFFVHDLTFLGTVSHQASVALRRAQLHEEVIWMKEYSESILRQMESGVIAATAQGHLTVINAAAARLLGIEAARAIGRHVAEVLPQELSAPLLDTLHGKGALAHCEVAVPRPAGGTLPLAVSTSVLPAHGAEPAGAILVCHDLSRIKELEEDKRRMERLAALGAFAAGIAHEIKNPLVAIRTLAELLPEQYDDAEFREAFSQVALQEISRIDALVHRLRTLGAASPASRRPISVLEPLEETLTLLSGECNKRRIRLVRAYHKPLRPVLGDHDQLKQVFLNLCMNSLEAMDEGGTLTVTVGMTPGPDGPPRLFVQVADTGPGIPDDLLGSMFEPFVTSKAGGSGLGLAICKGIVESHRGTLQAANRSDTNGAVVTVTLPTVQGDEVHALAASDGGEPAAAASAAAAPW
ncbi:MAG: hypothetical protein KatS3mg131_0597 [Candidatus Tectimicrobiota bacterium]|nr:MAG: hypothetical protein KatS3mg131_0597 [Candidatus Tectomicrobia bacterium]